MAGRSRASSTVRQRNITFLCRFAVALTLIWLIAMAILVAAQLVTDEDLDGGYAIIVVPQIDGVALGGPADRAGLRAGDRVELSGLSRHDRLTLLYGAPRRGEQIVIPVSRNGTVTPHRLTFGASKLSSGRRALIVFSLFTTLLVGAFAIFALVRNPSIDTLALWGFATTYSGLLPTYGMPDWLRLLITSFVGDASTGLFIAGSLVLALRATGTSIRHRWSQAAAVALGFVVYAVFQTNDVMIMGFGIAPPHLMASLTAGGALQLVPFMIGVLLIVGNAFVRARGPDRVRLRWITIGYGVFFVEALFALLQYRLPALTLAAWPNYVNGTLGLIGMAMFGTAVLRSELFDVGFVVNRAAIYGILTGALVGAFAGFNWLIGSALKGTGLAIPIAVLLAACIGISLQVIQRRVTRFVDRVFFRERYEIEQRLDRVARAAAQLSNDDAIARAVLYEPVEALRLSGGAFYRRTEEGAYELSASSGWAEGAPQRIDAGDPLVLQLAGAGEALSLDGLPHLAIFPLGPARPRTAVAVPGVNGPHAIALFAAHRSGATLDPDEAAVIGRIAQGATIAFERIRSVNVEHALNDLRGAILQLNERLTLNDIGQAHSSHNEPTAPGAQPRHETPTAIM